MTRASSEAGFSLVETLVALTVIAGMAGLLFDTIAANARAARQLEQKRAAILLAHSLLAQAALPPGAGELAPEGSAQGLGWRFTHRAFGSGARSVGVPLEEVRIDILDRTSGRRLTSVRTLRLVR